MKKISQRGVTLVELMVAIVIGSMIALAIYSVLSSFEGRKRTLTSVNDINQAGDYASNVLDNMARSAGSGFTQASAYAFGCLLKASKSNTALLPASSLPAPFSGVSPGTSGAFRLVPALIIPSGTTPGASGSGSDVLVLMSGAAGKSENINLLTAFPSSSALSLANTLAFSASDLILVADQQALSTGALSPCFIEQVSSSFTQAAGTTSLSLAGTYYAATIDSKNLSDLSKDSVALNLGNIGNANPPSFLLIGVGDNNTLFSYDLLQTNGKTTAQAMADGVFELHALYGVDDDEDGKVDTWVKPSASNGDYTLTNLMAGTPEAAQIITRIRALRIGLIMRTSLKEKDNIATSPLKLFSSLGSALEFSRTLTGDALKYRYRTVELIIPLRNALLN